MNLSEQDAASAKQNVLLDVLIKFLSENVIIIQF